MKTSADVLREAKALVERGWTQGTDARSANGTPVDATSKSAVCWCALGALDGAQRSGGMSAYYFLGRVVPTFTVSEWNDDPSRTKEEVLEAFDRAIALAEQSDG